MTVPFLILAAITIAGAMATMTLRKLVHCALALAVCLVGLAGMYLDLGAEFVGLAQILIYVGAVVILIVFAILLTRSDVPMSPRKRGTVGGAAISACVFGVLAWAIVGGRAVQRAGNVQPQGAIRQIGSALMERYVLPLEIVGLLLTAALIGAVVIAMEEKHEAR